MCRRNKQSRQSDKVWTQQNPTPCMPFGLRHGGVTELQQQQKANLSSSAGVTCVYACCPFCGSL